MSNTSCNDAAAIDRAALAIAKLFAPVHEGGEEKAIAGCRVFAEHALEAAVVEDEVNRLANDLASDWRERADTLAGHLGRLISLMDKANGKPLDLDARRALSAYRALTESA